MPNEIQASLESLAKSVEWWGECRGQVPESWASNNTDPTPPPADHSGYCPCGGTGKVLRWPKLWEAVFEKCPDSECQRKKGYVTSGYLSQVKHQECRSTGYIVRSWQDFWARACDPEVRLEIPFPTVCPGSRNHLCLDVIAYLRDVLISHQFLSHLDALRTRREGYLKAVEFYGPLVEAVEDLEKDRGFLGDDLRRVFSALHKIQEALGKATNPAS